MLITDPVATAPCTSTYVRDWQTNVIGVDLHSSNICCYCRAATDLAIKPHSNSAGGYRRTGIFRNSGNVFRLQGRPKPTTTIVEGERPKGFRATAGAARDAS